MNDADISGVTPPRTGGPKLLDSVREAIRTGALDARLHELAADIESRLGCGSRARMHREAAREIRP